ncbi:hypothetical protein DSM106972_060230 [Dulcicalothrix desertica PCC 7102]|uniref:Uncharacterized protein n=1 Tax=Dulcicalothrix desertica PCC 7102 TaxID=232991 RepID=A0A433V8X1_9CYAN|nr:hypothetical protein [Dulcicalothrix desertica]RUT02545.1 hypothetical protein DSM106972_060230 [Dulcicalothrix desertica PCC 7102]TWH55239.1 hypothetical protein CAL7102_03360 [Dulcicalothrix desertica PCC 7102]
MPRKIKLMTDYGCDPLWWDDDEVGDIEPESLPLSNNTIERLHKWAKAYDATLNWEDPTDSPGFPSLEAKVAFEKEGISLWKQLQTELAPDYQVVYFSDRLFRIITNLGELKALQQ